MYKPNFCAECGERITRTRWRFWTSRRFCPNCEGRFRKRQIIAQISIAAMLLSIGVVAGRGLRNQQTPPLIVQRGELPTALAPATAKTVSDAAETDDTPGADSSAEKMPEPKYGPDGTATERPTDPNEIVSICGARTQKGTPCQRRVRGTGRCWQHRGMPAMLPPSKLIVTGK